LISAFLIRQAFVVPLGAMLVAMLTGVLLPEYSSISQHISEMTVLNHPAALITRSAAVVTGASILAFSLGLILSTSSRFAFTAIAATIGGLAMMSGGIFVMGNPLHGLYALALFNALVPVFFAAELGQNQTILKLSMAASLITLIYFWLQIANLDPHGFHGLTQRIAIVVMFGWYSIAGYGLLCTGILPSKKSHHARSKPV